MVTSVDYAVFGISAIVIVKMLVDVLKTSFGIQGKWAIVASLIVSIVLGVCNQLSLMNAGFALWFKVVFYCVFAALGAGELHDVAKARQENLEVAKVTAELLKATTRTSSALADRVEAATEPTAASTSEVVK